MGFNFSLLLILFSAFFRADENGNLCKEKVIQAYKFSDKHNLEVKPGRANYLEVVTKSYFRSPYTAKDKIQEAEMKTEFYINGKRTLFTSGDIKVFQDDLHRITIVSTKREIYVNRLNSGAVQENNFLTQSAYRDSLLKYSDVVSCELLPNTTGEIRKVTMQPQVKMVEKSGVEKFEVYLEEKSGKVSKTNFIFQKGMNLQRLEMSFNSLQEKNTNLLDKGAYHTVLGKDGKLLEAYSGYKLVNQLRKK